MVLSSDFGKVRYWNKKPQIILAVSNSKQTTHTEQFKVLKVAGKVAMGAMSASFLHKEWRILCMNARVANSVDAIEE